MAKSKPLQLIAATLPLPPLPKSVVTTATDGPPVTVYIGDDKAAKLARAKAYLDKRAAAHPETEFKYSGHKPTVLTPSAIKKLKKPHR